MADYSQQLLEAMEALEAVADAVPPEEAFDHLDEASLQLFWREWPHASSWAGAVWRRLNSELADSASPDEEGRADTGGSG
ncbi:MAG: hypothetical protein ACRDY7_08610 [Acidimicrobiia bacterium]